jgi:protein gp37
MAANSAIQWTDATWNPLAGCTPVSDGCRNCYAASMALRLEAMGQEKYRGTAKRTKSDGRAVFTGKVNLDRAALEIPSRWKHPRRIFVNSMSDLFHEAVPDDFILEVFAMMERCPQHVFQVLTKRPARMAEWVRKHQEWVDYAAGEGEYLRRYGHVWVGTSVEHQQAADERIPHLLRVPAVVRFLSCEPLLGPVDLSTWLICERCKGDGTIFHTRQTGRRSFVGGTIPCPVCKGQVWRRDLHWVIAGGESGHGARPMHPDWPRRLREDCQNAGIPYFFKQHGEYVSWSHLHDLPGSGPYGPTVYPWTTDPLDTKQDSTCMVRVGKKVAGRLLDGRTWDEFPKGVL